ncbi:MAG: histidine phosphatase family protein, partial [Gemmatimonadales bacterium]
MRLYLMQHGEAKSKEENPDRPLTDGGRAEVEAVARLLSDRQLVPHVAAFHSGKTRARETAEILARNVKTVRGVAEWEGLQPLDDPAFWARNLGEMEED